MFVTIDPGLDTGWGIFDGAGRLIVCGLGDPRTHWQHVVTRHPKVAGPTIDDVWIEKPVIYPRSKARPADIMKLAVEAGRWAGIYSCLGVAVHFVEPAHWKGQVPKAIHHRRVLAGLTEAEIGAVELGCKNLAPSRRHNVLDAVGLGLWARRQLPAPAPHLRLVAP